MYSYVFDRNLIPAGNLSKIKLVIYLENSLVKCKYFVYLPPPHFNLDSFKHSFTSKNRWSLIFIKSWTPNKTQRNVFLFVSYFYKTINGRTYDSNLLNTSTFVNYCQKTNKTIVLYKGVHIVLFFSNIQYKHSIFLSFLHRYTLVAKTGLLRKQFLVLH